MHNPHSTGRRAVAPSSIPASVAHMAIPGHAGPAVRFFILLLVLMSAAKPAAAQGLPILRLEPANEKQFWVNMGGTSQHFKNAHRFNQQNSGLGLEYALDNDRSLVIGEYLNSVRGTTRYIGGAWTPLGYGPFRVGALAGFADGYPKMRGGGFFPDRKSVV